MNSKKKIIVFAVIPRDGRYVEMLQSCEKKSVSRVGLSGDRRGSQCHLPPPLPFQECL